MIMFIERKEGFLRGVRSMAQIQENHFRTFCKLSKQVQNVQNKIQTTEVNHQARIALHRELEAIQDQLEKLNLCAAQTCATYRQFEGMNREIISLYKVIEDRFEEYEIRLISKEAFDLSKNLVRGKIVLVAGQIEELKHKIAFLFRHRRPSLHNRKIINLAVKLSHEAEDVIMTKGKSLREHLAFIEKLRVRLQEVIGMDNVMLNSEEGELAMELYEIAELFRERQYGEGRMLLHSIRSKLSRAQKRRLDAASDIPREMIKILIEIAEGDPCIEWDQRNEAESVIVSLHA